MPWGTQLLAEPCQTLRSCRAPAPSQESVGSGHGDRASSSSPAATHSAKHTRALPSPGQREIFLTPTKIDLGNILDLLVDITLLPPRCKRAPKSQPSRGTQRGPNSKRAPGGPTNGAWVFGGGSGGPAAEGAAGAGAPRPPLLPRVLQPLPTPVTCCHLVPPRHKCCAWTKAGTPRAHLSTLLINLLQQGKERATGAVLLWWCFYHAGQPHSQLKGGTPSLHQPAETHNISQLQQDLDPCLSCGREFSSHPKGAGTQDPGKENIKRRKRKCREGNSGKTKVKLCSSV